MKFQMIIDSSSKVIVLTPENDGERMMLASCIRDRDTSPQEGAVTFKMSDDRAPYKKVIAVEVSL